MLSLDFKVNKNQDIIYAEIERLPFFSDGEEIDTESLERAIRRMEKKYPIRLGYIMAGPVEENTNDRYMTAMIKDGETHGHIMTIYGLTIREIYLKTCLFEYAYIRKNYKGK